MDRVRLIHWNTAEAKERAKKLKDAGYNVDHKPIDPAALKKLRASPPDAVVIDLSRLPSQGRDVGLTLRHYASTRQVPLVFVGGDAEKVKAIRKLLPDATYTTWAKIRSALRQAIKNPPKSAVAAKSVFDAYRSTPLTKKLGIKQDMTITLVSSPSDFEKTLGRLPKDVRLRKRAQGKSALVIWFTKSEKDLANRIERIAGLLDKKGSVWIAWPKKASGLGSDLTQQVVRKTGLAIGLVDYKVCSIDATWSGLLFTWRKRK